MVFRFITSNIPDGPSATATRVWLGFTATPMKPVAVPTLIVFSIFMDVTFRILTVPLFNGISKFEDVIPCNGYSSQ